MARVLVTRALPEAEETAAMLRAAGHVPVLLPLRRVEEIPANWPGEAPDALIATSRNAFRFEIPRAWRDLPVYCVGERTAEAARAAGFGAVHAAEGDAAMLSRDLAAFVPPDRHLAYLAGEPRRDELETGLIAAGRRLSVIPRYRLVPDPSAGEVAASALRESEVVLHFSAESARAFAELLIRLGLDEAARALGHICLSSFVAEVLHATLGPVRRLAIARKPDAGSMLALIPT